METTTKYRCVLTFVTINTIFFITWYSTYTMLPKLNRYSSIQEYVLAQTDPIVKSFMFPNSRTGKTDNTGTHPPEEWPTFKGDPSDTSQFHSTRKMKKLILVYTKFFGSSFFPFTTEYPPHTKRCGCSLDMCQITKDKTRFNISHILIFHEKDMPSLENLNKLHKQRPKGQLWLWLSLECSARSKSTEPYKHLFDLTTSYRLNSDIMLPHRYYFRKDKYPRPEQENNKNTYGNDTAAHMENYAKGKTGLLIFTASHSCNSYRKDLVLRLVQLGLNVTKYGKCRYKEIPQTHYKSIDPYKVPYHKYKFVLAFENSICDDYISTRYWFQSLRWNTVAIVLGGGNYSDYRLAIPGTYIEALKFPSPEKLAEYILRVDKDDELYNKFFEYKKHYTFYDLHRPRWCNLWLCEICNKLHYGGWNLRKEPLALINATKECDLNPNALKYYKWLNMKGDMYYGNRH